MGRAVTLRTDRPGIALLVVMLLTMVVAAIAAGAALIGANSYLINQYDQRISLLETAADGGLEKARARLNADPSLFPDTGFNVLERHVPVLDAFGNAYAGVTRDVYAGPVGGGPGQYGTFGTIVAVARDADGAEVVRRLDLNQESFAVYSYFTDFEPSTIAFGNNDQLYGPVHSNSNIKVRSSGATFHGDVTTAGIFEGAQYATFLADTTSLVPRILMPTANHISRLRSRAAPGYMAFNSTPGGGTGQSRTRIHFISRDVDNDGVEEGFIRVYDSSDENWVTGNYNTSWSNTRNCGHLEADSTFNTAAGDPNTNHSVSVVMNSLTARCYLGGADELNATSQARKGAFRSTDGLGSWRTYPGTVHPDVADELRGDGNYLFPLDRELNPGFRGVIYVDGKVVVSGTVRGRVTLAATGDIIIGDDIIYQNDPGGGTCEDMLGLFSGGTIYVADNTLNSPQVAPNGAWRTYDDTGSEHIHATLLSLIEFTVQNYGLGATSAEPCNGVAWGRGCLFITGGLIQQTRGAVATSAGTGYVKRYTHDTCAFENPPPYFPSTGHFWRGRYYEVNPTGFDVAQYFRALN